MGDRNVQFLLSWTQQHQHHCRVVSNPESQTSHMILRNLHFKQIPGRSKEDMSIGRLRSDQINAQLFHLDMYQDGHSWVTYLTVLLQ